MNKTITVFTFLFTWITMGVWAVEKPDFADMVVAKDSSGNYTTIQEAINATPNSSSKRTVIYIKNGVYEETLNVAASKKNLTLWGEDSARAIISYKTEKTLDFATIQVYASGFIACNLTIENTAGPSYGPAQAIRQESDKSIYLNCRILGNQDTYRNSNVRSYTYGCHIEGTVDFIFGSGTIVFENCHIYSKGGSAITAASTKDYVPFGYVFRNCKIDVQSGKSTTLGRPWGDYAAVAYLGCELPKGINAVGWDNWGKPERESTSRFREYKNTGAGADTTKRVKWAPQLTDAQAADYNTLNVLKTMYSSSKTVDNWNPYADLYQAGLSDSIPSGKKTIKSQARTIYPNPSGSGCFRIQMKDEVHSAVEVKIFSLSGALIFKDLYPNEPVLTINSNLRKGTYILQLNTEDGSSSDLVSVFE